MPSIGDGDRALTFRDFMETCAMDYRRAPPYAPHRHRVAGGVVLDMLFFRQPDLRSPKPIDRRLRFCLIMLYTPSPNHNKSSFVRSAVRSFLERVKSVK